MIVFSTAKVKVLAIVAVALLYLYFLVMLKILYQKRAKLDHLMDMAADTHKQIMQLYDMDRNLMHQIEQLKNM